MREGGGLMRSDGVLRTPSGAFREPRKIPRRAPKNPHGPQRSPRGPWTASLVRGQTHGRPCIDGHDGSSVPKSTSVPTPVCVPGRGRLGGREGERRYSPLPFLPLPPSPPGSQAATQDARCDTLRTSNSPPNLRAEFARKTNKHRRFPATLGVDAGGQT